MKKLFILAEYSKSLKGYKKLVSLKDFLLFNIIKKICKVHLNNKIKVLTRIV